MKKFVIISVFLSFNFAFSQEYYPLVEENNEWNTIFEVYTPPNMPAIYWTESFKISGDTVINEKNYKKLYKTDEEFPVNWTYWGGLREENQKIWHIGTNNYPEQQLYDFMVNVGDTVSFLYAPMVVDSIVNKPINGANRKHIYFSYFDPFFTEYWIEGIGSNLGVLQSGFGNAIGGWSWTLCKFEDGELVYMNPDYNSCYLVSTGIEENKAGPELTISPNPVRGQFELRSSMFEVEGLKIISIYNGEGRKVKEIRNTEESESITINAEGWNRGLYLIRLETGGKVFSSKLIIQ